MKFLDKLKEVFSVKEKAEACAMSCKTCLERCCANCFNGDVYTEATGDPRNPTYFTVVTCDYQLSRDKKSASRGMLIPPCQFWQRAYPDVYMP